MKSKHKVGCRMICRDFGIVQGLSKENTQYSEKKVKWDATSADSKPVHIRTTL